MYISPEILQDAETLSILVASMREHCKFCPFSSVKLDYGVMNTLNMNALRWYFIQQHFVHSEQGTVPIRVHEFVTVAIACDKMCLLINNHRKKRLRSMYDDYHI